jgi:hypothetical protein
MKTFNKIAIAVALSLGLAATAYAQPGRMGGGMGPCAQQGGQQQNMQGNMGQGRMQGMNQGGMGQGRMQGMQGNMGQGRMQAVNFNGKQGAGQQLMTPEERTAMQDKMRNAKSPEERQQLATANHAEMQKRAAEKGITLPEQRGPYGRGASPATPEQAR